MFENIENWTISSQVPNKYTFANIVGVYYKVKVQRLSRKRVALRKGEMGDTYE